MKNNSELFLVDTNSFITPHESFYPFDFAGSFWTQIETHIANGTIVILDMVKEEIEKGSDDLSEWMKKLEIGKFIDHREPLIVNKYSEILDYIQHNNCYKDNALREWSKANIADAWLIATACVYGYTIVTFEIPNNNLNSRQPSKEAKIPDICSYFGVAVKNLYDMIRKLHISM